ncbi:MAG TPA: diguanylate cyclase, partial [Thermodesulfobacteriota bacterium]|nr:diguanylate cyclase [Thermodesulfobacteriota bacterium]
MEQAASELVKFMTAVEKCSDLIVLMDAGGVIEYVNPMFELVTGYTRGEIVGQNRSVLIPPDSTENDSPPREADIGPEGWHGTVRNRKKDGGSFWSKSSVYPINGRDGAITNYLSVCEDITEQMVSGEKLQYLTRHDGVTGLTNRSWFINRLNEWIDGAGAEATGALFLFDLDQFKFISDSFGHGMGDELLRRVGKLLQIMLRYLNSRYLKEPVGESLLSRLSGDEFAVFLPSVGRVESVTIAEQIRKGLEDFYQPDAQCHLTASIGVAFYPEHGKTSTELLTRADSAMYRAKDLGRNRFHFYSPEEQAIERMHLRLQRKEEILKALKEDRFEPWYQPILDLKDGTVKHYEVLARMRDRDGKVILPGPFIDIAERFGLVSHIARLITEKALTLQSEMKGRGYPLSFCINVSGKELGDKEFLYYLQSKIYETGADPES